MVAMGKEEDVPQDEGVTPAPSYQQYVAHTAPSHQQHPHSYYGSVTGPTNEPIEGPVGNTTRVVHGSKKVYEAYMLALPPIGFLGAHQAFLNRPGWAVAYFFTFGFFGMGWIIDLFRMPYLVRDANERRKQTRPTEQRDLCDAYILWLPPFGLLGFHHFYLRRPGWGALYLFTCGLFGIGWLVDSCLLYKHVRECNKQIREEEAQPDLPADGKKSLAVAYALAAFPITGVLGIHHLYLKNYLYFALYICTLGNYGIGWIYDLFRIPVLVRRANECLNHPEKRAERHLDDAYGLWLPFGGLHGFHHLYLGNYILFILYCFTCGGFGIGWLIDLFLMPHHTKKANERVQAYLQSRIISNVVISSDGTTQVYPVSQQPVGGAGYLTVATPAPVHSFQQLPPPMPGQPPVYYGAVAPPQPSTNTGQPTDDTPPPYSEKN